MWIAVAVSLLLLALLWAVVGNKESDTLEDRGKCRLTYHSGLWRRPLGHCIETFCLKTMPGGQYSTISALYFVSRVKLSYDVIATALARLAKKHPLLHARYAQDDKGQHYFEQMPEIRVIFEESGEPDWKTRYDDEVNHNFDIHKGPLWTATYFPQHSLNPDFRDGDYQFQSVITFCMHHAIMDGSSFVNVLMKDFTAILGGLCRGDIQKQDPVISVDVPWPPELVLPQLKSGWQYWRFLFGKSGLRSILGGSHANVNPWVKNLASLKGTNSSSRRHHIIPVTFSHEATEKLTSACRNHGVKVQAAVQTISSIALADTLQEGNFREDIEIVCRTTVALTPRFRNFLTDKTLTANFSILSAPLTLSPEWRTSFWSKVTEAEGKLYSDLIRNCIIMLHTFRLVVSLFSFGILSFKRNENEKAGYVPYPLEITNLGNCDKMNVDETVRLRARYSGLYNINASPLFFNSLSTLGGQLSWTICYTDSLVSDDFAEAYVVKLLEIIDIITNEKEMI